MKATKIYTLKEFNEIYIAHKRDLLKHIHVHKVKGFSLIKTKSKVKLTTKSDDNGIPYIEREVLSKTESFDTNEFNKLIVAYLQLFTPTLKCNITNTTGRMINGRYVQNKVDRGRADITAQYDTFELCVETKKKYEKQLDSQIEFQQMANKQSFRKYILTRSFEDFQQKVNEIFKLF
jgi:hypothetical protein